MKKNLLWELSETLVLCLILIMVMSSAEIPVDHGKVKWVGTSKEISCTGWGIGISGNIGIGTNTCKHICVDWVFFEDGFRIIKPPRECEEWEIEQ